MAKEIIIKTQKEWDALPEAFEGFTVVKVDTKPEVLLTITSVPKNGHVVLWGSSHAVLWGSSHAELWGSSHAELRGSSHAELWGSSHAVLRESSHAVLWGSSHAVLRESSHAVLRGSSHAELRGSSHAVLRESSHAELWESSHAVLWESSHAVLRGSSHAVLRESSHAELRGSSHAEAHAHVSVHLQSDRASVLLFAFAVCFQLAKGKITKKSKTATVIKPPLKKGVDAWLNTHGITPATKVTLFKRVSVDFKTQEGTENETLWEIGTTVVHPNWNPKEDECGAGKFHACATPYFCDDFRDKKDDRYVAIEVAKKDLYVWPDNPSYPYKIAFRTGTVLYECDKFGNQKEELQKAV